MAEEAKKFIIGYDYTEEVNKEAIHEVVKMGFGHGTNAVSEIGNKQAPILDYDRLKDNFVSIDSYSNFRNIEIEGSSYKAVTEKVNNEFGLGAHGNAKKVTFGNTLKVATNNAMEETDNYEYGIRILYSKVLGASLTSWESIKTYMLPSARRDIDGEIPEGATKPTFPTTDEGIERLFDKYGTHLITKAIFGTKYEYYYLRESTEKTTSIKRQVDCNLSVKYANDKNGLQNLGIEPSNTYENSYTECQKHSLGIEVEKRMGGASISDISQWQASCNFNVPQSIAMIGYVYSSSETDDGLIPLWELVDDPSRAAKMQQVYDAYVKKYTPEYKQSKQIIVDVYAKYFGDGNAPDSLFIADYKDKMRKFIKLDENIFNHLSWVTHGSYYFYYALGYAGKYGLTELKIVHEDDPDGSEWIRRGNSAQDGVSGGVKNRVLAIKVAPLKNGKVDVSDDKLVSGFGLKIEDDIRKISLGTTTAFHWVQNGSDWYKGLCHDKIHCLYTTDKLNEF